MRQGFAYTLAVVGVVAAVAVIALNESPASTQLNFRALNEDNVDFNHFLATHGKSYANKDEYNFRLQQYRASIARINAHNSNNAGEESYHLKVNRFADMTHEEYKNMLGFKANNKTVLRPAPVGDISSLPASIDWREKNAVNPVKDQSQCGSCWAFSTVASLEGRNAIKTGTLQSLSEQQLVDCDRADGNQGCNGGDMGTAMTYISSNPLETEKSYPYAGVD
jgi:cathepsin L